MGRRDVGPRKYGAGADEMRSLQAGSAACAPPGQERHSIWIGLAGSDEDGCDVVLERPRSHGLVLVGGGRIGSHAIQLGFGRRRKCMRSQKSLNYDPVKAQNTRRRHLDMSHWDHRDLSHHFNPRTNVALTAVCCRGGMCGIVRALTQYKTRIFAGNRSLMTVSRRKTVAEGFSAQGAPGRECITIGAFSGLRRYALPAPRSHRAFPPPPVT